MPGIFAWPANSAENIFNLIKQKQKAEKCCFEQTFYVLMGEIRGVEKGMIA